VHTVKLGPGPDGKNCTADDEEIKDTGHYMTVKDYYIIYTYGGPEVPDSISFIDPSYLNPEWWREGKCSPRERSCDVHKISGKVDGVQKEIVKVCGWTLDAGLPVFECRKITWVCSISPTEKRKEKLGITKFIATDEDWVDADGWNIYWDTTTIKDGVYVVKATMVDVNGNKGTDSMMIYIRNYPTDLDGNMEVNIIDISKTAKAFGSYPGHERWDPIADVNSDDVINIIDISMVARDFGRTL